MEPVLELATRITNLLWFLHDLFPYVQSVPDLLAQNLREKVGPEDLLIDYAGVRNGPHVKFLLLAGQYIVFADF
jgi:hypothetical protein